MAYKIFREYYVSAHEIKEHLVAFLCGVQIRDVDHTQDGVGWTLLYSYYYNGEEGARHRNDWWVVHSPGENGKQDIYMRIGFTGATAVYPPLGFATMLSWNVDLLSGPNYPISTNMTYAYPEDPGYIHILADLDKFIVSRSDDETGELSAIGHAGLLDSIYDTTIATGAGGVPAGANSSASLDLVPSSWFVGGKVLIRDSQNIEWLTIAGISGNTVLFSNVSTAYLPGCRIAQHYPLYYRAGAKLGVPISFQGVKQTTYIANTVETNTLGHVTLLVPRGVCVSEQLAVLSNSVVNPGFYGWVPDFILKSSASYVVGKGYVNPATGATYRASATYLTLIGYKPT